MTQVTFHISPKLGIKKPPATERTLCGEISKWSLVLHPADGLCAASERIDHFCGVIETTGDTICATCLQKFRAVVVMSQFL